MQSIRSSFSMNTRSGVAARAFSTNAAALSKVFFDMEIGGEPAGRIVFKLYDDVTPKTAGM